MRSKAEEAGKGRQAEPQTQLSKPRSLALSREPRSLELKYQHQRPEKPGLLSADICAPAVSTRGPCGMGGGGGAARTKHHMHLAFQITAHAKPRMLVTCDRTPGPASGLQ